MIIILKSMVGLERHATKDKQNIQFGIDLFIAIVTPYH